MAVPRAQAKTSRRRRPASKRGMLAMVLALAKAPRRRRPGRKDLAAAALRAQAEARRTASTVRTEAARCPWRAPLRHGLQAPCLWCAGCGAGSLAGEPPPLGPCYGRVCFPMHGMHVGASCQPSRSLLAWIGDKTSARHGMACASACRQMYSPKDRRVAGGGLYLGGGACGADDGRSSLFPGVEDVDSCCLVGACIGNCLVCLRLPGSNGG